MYLRIIISTIIVIALWIAESYCSKLKNPLWGGIMPLLVLATSVYILATGLINFDRTSFIVFFVVNFFITEGWIEGRVKYNKRQKAELDKMKARDIDS